MDNQLENFVSRNEEKCNVSFMQKCFHVARKIYVLYQSNVEGRVSRGGYF
jgi:hypothetical protein